MAPPIGFVIVTYRDPPQLVRLATRLQELYGRDAPIAVHHDFDKCAFDTAILPPGVQVVRPHVVTRWGHWSVVEGGLRAMRLLHAGAAGPDFTVLLTGADYPVAPAERVLQDLRGNGADAYIHHSEVTVWGWDRRRPPGPLGLSVNEGWGNQKATYRRYYPTIYRPLGIRIKVRNPFVAPLLTPFRGAYRCYAGEAWFTLGRRAVESLLHTRDHDERIVRWFAERPVPEEGFAHTVLRNDPGLRIDRRHFRYIDWRNPVPRPHPRDLQVEDVPAILASGAHFARKFDVDAPALDALDAALGLPPWRASEAARSASAG